MRHVDIFWVLVNNYLMGLMGAVYQCSHFLGGHKLVMSFGNLIWSGLCKTLAWWWFLRYFSMFVGEGFSNMFLWFSLNVPRWLFSHIFPIPDVHTSSSTQVPHNKPESKYLGNDPLVERLLSGAAQGRTGERGQWVIGQWAFVGRCCGSHERALTLTMCKSNLERK